MGHRLGPLLLGRRGQRLWGARRFGRRRRRLGAAGRLGGRFGGRFGMRLGGRLAGRHRPGARALLPRQGAARRREFTQAARHVRRARALRRVLRQQRGEHLRERARVLGRRRGLGQDRDVQRGESRGVERGAALDGGVEGRAERPQVGRRLDVAALQLLGRHVLRGADDRAGVGEAGRGVQDAGDAEVGDDRAAVGEQDVVRFEVAVDDAGGVRVGQCGGDLGAEGGDLGPGQAPRRFAYGTGQRLAGHVLHHDPRLGRRVGRAVGCLAHHVVHGDDAGVAQPGRRAGLAQRPGDHRGALLAGELDREQDFLEGDLAVQRLVVPAPDAAHSAPPDRFQQPVTAAHDAFRAHPHPHAGSITTATARVSRVVRPVRRPVRGLLGGVVRGV